MDLYTIHNGTLKRLARDWELSQVIKYCATLFLGVVIGYLWHTLHNTLATAMQW